MHNTYVISGKGGVFLKCSGRLPKYQPQPQLRCPAFAPLPYARLGETLLVWAGAPLPGPVAIDIRADMWVGELDQPSVNTLPGDGLAWIDGGMRWVMAPSRTPTLGWRISGPRPTPAVGTRIWLRPVNPG